MQHWMLKLWEIADWWEVIIHSSRDFSSEAWISRMINQKEEKKELNCTYVVIVTRDPNQFKRLCNKSSNISHSTSGRKKNLCHILSDLSGTSRLERLFFTTLWFKTKITSLKALFFTSYLVTNLWRFPSV